MSVARHSPLKCSPDQALKTDPASEQIKRRKIAHTWNVQKSERNRMDEVLYFHVALEPHLKHSGSIINRRILFLAEVQVDAARKTKTNPDDEDALHQEAQRLAAELLPIATPGWKAKTS